MVILGGRAERAKVAADSRRREFFPVRFLCGHRRGRCFTLLELLVLCCIAVVLFSLALPMLSHAQAAAKNSACMENLRHIGESIVLYCNDSDGFIPAADDGYWGSSLLRLRSSDGRRVGLGRLVDDYGIEVETFGCPRNPGRTGGIVRRMWLDNSTVYSAYLYRETESAFAEQLARAENNTRAMAMDFACVSIDGVTLAPHQFETVSILYGDGHVELRCNSPQEKTRFTSPARSNGGAPSGTYELWERADRPQ